MKNIVLSFVSFGLFLLSCNGNKTKLIYNSYSSHSTIANALHVEDTIHYSKTLSQEIKEELIVFCDLFVSAIQSNNIEDVKNVIDFPIWVECFKDFDEYHGFTFGDTITVDDFFKYRKLIFDNTFFNEVKEFKTLLKEDNTEDKIDYGFDRETFHFRISTSHGKDDEWDGTNRLFRFEKRENKYKLVLVFCAG